jgi:hypothetical protein
VSFFDASVTTPELFDGLGLVDFSALLPPQRPERKLNPALEKLDADRPQTNFRQYSSRFSEINRIHRDFGGGRRGCRGVP